MKLPFRRNKQESSDLPKEVQDYYQSEKRQRRGVAGLLAVGTLLATIVLALGLFFGGRWVYRTAFDRDSKPTNVAQNDDKNNNEPIPGTEDNEQNQNNTDTNTSNQPQTLPGGENDSDATPATPGTTSSTSTDLPNTGPGDVVATFIGTVIVATSLHYAVTRKQLV